MTVDEFLKHPCDRFQFVDEPDEPDPNRVDEGLSRFTELDIDAVVDKFLDRECGGAEGASDVG